jgi:hypothetical protein
LTRLVAAVAFVGLVCAAAPLHAAPDCRSVSQAIIWGQQWLIANQRTDGLFAYEYRPLEDAYPDDDNIVRQLGAFWAVVSTLPVHSDARRIEAIVRFRKAMRGYFARAEAGAQKIAFIDEGGVGKVNAAALALLALLALDQQGLTLSPNEREEVALLAAGIGLMATGAGGYWYVYFLPDKKNHITPYGSGEALLALATYASVTNDEALRLGTLAEFQRYYDAYLRDLPSFNSTYLKGFFSWGLMALVLLKEPDEATYTEFVRPLLRIAIDYRRSNPACARKGCIERENVTDAPFFEGFMAAYPSVERFERDPALRDEILDYIDKAVGHLINLQVTPRQLPRALANIKPAERILGGICWDKACSRMRADMNQHVMMACCTTFVRFAVRHPSHRRVSAANRRRSTITVLAPSSSMARRLS